MQLLFFLLPVKIQERCCILHGPEQSSCEGTGDQSWQVEYELADLNCSVMKGTHNTLMRKPLKEASLLCVALEILKPHQSLHVQSLHVHRGYTLMCLSGCTQWHINRIARCLYMHLVHSCVSLQGAHLHLFFRSITQQPKLSVRSSALINCQDMNVLIWALNLQFHWQKLLQAVTAAWQTAGLLSRLVDTVPSREQVWQLRIFRLESTATHARCILLPVLFLHKTSTSTKIGGNFEQFGEVHLLGVLVWQ